jgi:integrase
MNDQNILRRHLRPAAEKLKMDLKKGLGDTLRTSRATWTREARVDAKAVQASMRHSRISTTMEIYAQGGSGFSAESFRSHHEDGQ